MYKRVQISKWLYIGVYQLNAQINSKKLKFSKYLGIYKVKSLSLNNNLIFMIFGHFQQLLVLHIKWKLNELHMPQGHNQQGDVIKTISITKKYSF